MPKDIEDELKLDNWLSIVTYDIIKYVAAGGVVSVTASLPDGGIVIHLKDVNLEKAHSRFRQFVANQDEPAQPAPAGDTDGAG